MMEFCANKNICGHGSDKICFYVQGIRRARQQRQLGSGGTGRGRGILTNRGAKSHLQSPRQTLQNGE